MNVFVFILRYTVYRMYHVWLLPRELKLHPVVVRHGVEHGVLHKNTDRSTNEGGEQVNVDVVACAVETSL